MAGCCMCIFLNGTTSILVLTYKMEELVCMILYPCPSESCAGAFICITIRDIFVDDDSFPLGETKIKQLINIRYLEHATCHHVVAQHTDFDSSVDMMDSCTHTLKSSLRGIDIL